MPKRGGARPGAGRPKGSKDKCTRDHGATIAELARRHADVAIKALVQIASSGDSESARVTAANALLDRGFGRPSQAIEHTGKGGGPIEYYEISAEAFDRELSGIVKRAREGCDSLGIDSPTAGEA